MGKSKKSKKSRRRQSSSDEYATDTETVDPPTKQLPPRAVKGKTKTVDPPTSIDDTTQESTSTGDSGTSTTRSLSEILEAVSKTAEETAKQILETAKTIGAKDVGHIQLKLADFEPVFQSIRSEPPILAVDESEVEENKRLLAKRCSHIIGHIDAFEKYMNVRENELKAFEVNATTGINQLTTDYLVGMNTELACFARTKELVYRETREFREIIRKDVISLGYDPSRPERLMPDPTPVHAASDPVPTVADQTQDSSTTRQVSSVTASQEQPVISPSIQTPQVNQHSTVPRVSPIVLRLPPSSQASSSSQAPSSSQLPPTHIPPPMYIPQPSLQPAHVSDAATSSYDTYNRDDQYAPKPIRPNTKYPFVKKHIQGGCDWLLIRHRIEQQIRVQNCACFIDENKRVPEHWTLEEVDTAKVATCHFIENQLTDALMRRIKQTTEPKILLDRVEQALQYKGDSAVAKWTRLIHSITYNGETSAESFIEEFDQIVAQLRSCNPRFDAHQEKVAFLIAIRNFAPSIQLEETAASQLHPDGLSVEILKTKLIAACAELREDQERTDLSKGTLFYSGTRTKRRSDSRERRHNKRSRQSPSRQWSRKSPSRQRSRRSSERYRNDSKRRDNSPRSSKSAKSTYAQAASKPKAPPADSRKVPFNPPPKRKFNQKVRKSEIAVVNNRRKQQGDRKPVSLFPYTKNKSFLMYNEKWFDDEERQYLLSVQAVEPVTPERSESESTTSSPSRKSSSSESGDEALLTYSKAFR